jgi:glycosylphosphatidylinositol deacylase
MMAVFTKSKRRGSPVLFLSGQAGSYRQVRSVAAAAAKLSSHSKELDFFAIDFNGELSALSGE